MLRSDTKTYSNLALSVGWFSLTILLSLLSLLYLLVRIVVVLSLCDLSVALRIVSTSRPNKIIKLDFSLLNFLSESPLHVTWRWSEVGLLLLRLVQIRVCTLLSIHSCILMVLRNTRILTSIAGHHLLVLHSELRMIHTGRTHEKAVVTSVLRMRGMLLWPSISRTFSVDKFLASALQSIARTWDPCSILSFVSEDACSLHLFFAFLGPFCGVETSSLLSGRHIKFLNY